MPQPLSPIRRLLDLAEKDLESFKQVVSSVKGEIPQKQIDAFFTDLADHVKTLRTEASKNSFVARAETDFEAVEKRIISSIDFLQKDARAKNCKGNIGNIQTALSDFLKQVKEQITSVKKKTSKVERAGNVELDKF